MVLVSLDHNFPDWVQIQMVPRKNVSCVQNQYDVWTFFASKVTSERYGLCYSHKRRTIQQTKNHQENRTKERDGPKDAYGQGEPNLVEGQNVERGNVYFGKYMTFGYWTFLAIFQKAELKRQRAHMGNPSSTIVSQVQANSGENSRTILASDWERTDQQKRVCKVVEEIASEIGAKHINAVRIEAATPIDLGFPHGFAGTGEADGFWMANQGTFDLVPLRPAITPAKY
ncbi:hypothetical protein C8J56DRAFT_897022 [Mycena floridula]|nr:hypothetical protein C8J56DRAFT_897022 [Mycena floridula]